MQLTYIFRVIIACTFVLAFLPAKAQIFNKRYFPDPQPGQISHIFDDHKVEDGVIISTKHITASTQEPVLMKLDVKGRIVWTCGNKAVTGAKTCDKFDIEAFSDGYVYGTSYQTAFAKQYNTFWKVNALTGEVVWQRNSYFANYSFVDLADYDSSVFLATYFNGTQPTLAFLSKNTGDTISTKGFASYANFLNVATDDNKNIYLSKDNILTKYSTNNLNFPIWERTYSGSYKNLDYIHNIYVDKEDKIYLFGRNGGNLSSQNGIIIKVNTNTGLQEWGTTATVEDVIIADFADFNGYIYATYQHATVGGGYYTYQTSKVNKADGKLEWDSYLDMSTLGFPTSNSGNGESAKSIDVDCKGNVYLTGYYGDANYGPEAWGIMKLSNVDGSKIYDLTITIDSANYDNNSSGLVTHVFGDTVVFLGMLDTSAASTIPYYVSLSASAGKIIERKPIGNDYESLSRTINILEDQDSIFILKQQGRFVILEKYDDKRKLQWKKLLYTDSMLQAGQIKVVDNIIYLTAYEVLSDSFSNNKSVPTNKLLFYKLSTTNGNILQADTAHYTSSVVVPIELEADKDAAFVFYYKDASVYTIKWNSTGLSNPVFLEIAGKNIDYKGQLNIVVNRNKTELLYAGHNNILSINKASLSVNSLLNNTAARNYYDNLYVKDSILFLAGSDSSSHQIITVIELVNNKLLWEKKYLADGELYKIAADKINYLYVTGTSKNTTTMHQVSPINGNLLWTNTEDSLKYPVTVPYDIKIHQTLNYLALAGAKINNDGSTDAIIRILDLEGKDKFHYVGKDEVTRHSQANAIVVLKDSLWVGGSLNRKQYPQQGFIYTLYQPFIDVCYTSFASDSVEVCYNYKSPSGKYTWNKSGIYLDTLINAKGCDSIIVINLKMMASYSSISETACKAFTSPSGKYTWTKKGIYLDTLINSQGCDSIMTIDLKIMATYSTIAKNACNTFTSPSGKYRWTASGSYTDTIINSNGCDSIITVNLTIDKTDTGVTQNANVLTANLKNASYQWLDCNNGYSTISSETNRVFTATKTGSYAVEITNGLCKDTSACYTVNIVGLKESINLENLTIYPNPSNGLINILGLKDSYIYTLTDVLGKKIMQGKSVNIYIDINALIPGLYLLKIESNNQQKIFKIIKQ